MQEDDREVDHDELELEPDEAAEFGREGGFGDALPRAEPTGPGFDPGPSGFFANAGRAEFEDEDDMDVDLGGLADEHDADGTHYVGGEARADASGLGGLGGSGGANDENGDAQSEASGLNVARMRASMDVVPTYEALLMGEGIKPVVPVFGIGAQGIWVVWEKDTFTQLSDYPVPVRALCVNTVISSLAVGARNLSDCDSPSDPVSKRMVVAQMQLAGMLTIGTSKGRLVGENYEIQKAKYIDKKSDEAIGRLRNELDGHIVSDSFCPDIDSPDQADVRCPRYHFVFEYVNRERLPDGTLGSLAGVRVWKLVYDRTHSDDELWEREMTESSDVYRNGQASAMPEEKRRPAMEKAYKLQRMMTDTNELSRTAVTMYKRTKNTTDVIDLYRQYAGASDQAPEGRPLFRDMNAEIPEGCRSMPIQGHPTLGGTNALGPSWALNAKRSNDVLTAGFVDKNGVIEIDALQADITNYFDNENRFRPHPDLLKRQCFHWVHPPTVTNFLTANFGRQVHTSYQPESILLEMFWDEFKSVNRTLIKLGEVGVTSFTECTDIVHGQFFSFMTARDQSHAAIEDRVLNNAMLQSDSLDLGSLESINPRCYGRMGENGKYIVEPEQILTEYSVETERVHGRLVVPWRQRELERISNHEWEFRQARGIPVTTATCDIEGGKLARDLAKRRAIVERKFNEATEACILLGLRRFEHAFTSAHLSEKIPKGWAAIWNGTLDAIAETGKRAVRKVNPKHMDCDRGTANLAFAHDSQTTATDFSPLGHYHVFLMAFLSSGAAINGDEYHLMREGVLQAMEVAQEVSTYLVMCGGPGIGKSLRGMRLEKLLVKGWMQRASGGTEIAGRNGGMEWTCARLLYYDEIMKEFAQAEGDRLEFLKQASWDQQVQHLRTVKIMGKNGSEEWATQVLITLHLESYWINCNLGPLGQKSNVDPTDNRMALLDRTFCHCVQGANSDAVSFSEEDFAALFSDPSFLIKLDRFRVMTGLTAMTLIFIKNIPFCHPDIAYALTLFSALDSMLWEEYNLPRPSPRKQTKRRMVLMVLAAESALASKFFLKESAAAYKDMHPDEDDMLAPWNIAQMVDIVKGLQEGISFETTINAWSHGTDYHTALSPHVMHTKTLLAQLHGCQLDMKAVPMMPERADGGAGAGAQHPHPPPTRMDGTSVVSSFLQMERVMGRSTARGQDSANATHAPTRASMKKLATRMQLERQCRTKVSKRLEENPSLARQAIAEHRRERAAEERRECEAARRPPPKRPSDLPSGDEAFAVFKTILTDSGSGDGAMHRLAGTRKEIPATRAAQALMPDTQDLINSGYDEGFLADIIDAERDAGASAADAQSDAPGQSAAPSDAPNADGATNADGAPGQSADAGPPTDPLEVIRAEARKFGTSSRFKEPVFGTSLSNSSWEYLKLNAESTSPSATEIDWCWRTMRRQGAKPTAKKAAEGSATVVVATSKAADSESLHWHEYERLADRWAKQGRNGFFNVKSAMRMTPIAIANSMYLAQMSGPHNEVRHPVMSDSGGGIRYRCSSLYDADGDTELTAMTVASAKKNAFTTIKPKICERDLRGTGVAAMPRPADDADVVRTHTLQNRIDVLTRSSALPAAYIPVRYDRGVPLKIQDGTVYLNSGIARDHARLCVEVSASLSHRPGIFRGVHGDVPSSFRSDAQTFVATASRSAFDEVRRDRDRNRNRDRSARKRRRRDAATAGDDESASSHSSNSSSEDDEPDEADDRNETGGNADGADAEAFRREAQSRAHERVASELKRNVQQGSGAPDAGRCNANAKATARELVQQLGEDGTIESMPYGWQMFGTYFTFVAADTLYIDSKARSYMKKMYEMLVCVDDDGNEAPLLADSFAELLRDHCQITLRFCAAPRSASSPELFPLSAKYPETRSRVLHADRHTREGAGSETFKNTAAPQLSTIFLSFYECATVNETDETYVRYQTSKFGRQAIKHTTGNVFAFSTWSSFTLNALRARGMLNEKKDLARVMDAGHFLLVHARAAIGVLNHKKALAANERRKEAKRLFLERREEDRRARELAGGDEHALHGSEEEYDAEEAFKAHYDVPSVHTDADAVATDDDESDDESSDEAGADEAGIGDSAETREQLRERRRQAREQKRQVLWRKRLYLNLPSLRRTTCARPLSFDAQLRMAMEEAQRTLDDLEQDNQERAHAVREEDVATVLAAGSARDLLNLKRKWQDAEETRRRTKSEQLPRMKLVF